MVVHRKTEIGVFATDLDFLAKFVSHFLALLKLLDHLFGRLGDVKHVHDGVSVFAIFTLEFVHLHQLSILLLGFFRRCVVGFSRRPSFGYADEGLELRIFSVQKISHLVNLDFFQIHSVFQSHLNPRFFSVLLLLRLKLLELVTDILSLAGILCFGMLGFMVVLFLLLHSLFSIDTHSFRLVKGVVL